MKWHSDRFKSAICVHVTRRREETRPTGPRTWKTQKCRWKTKAKKAFQRRQRRESLQPFSKLPLYSKFWALLTSSCLIFLVLNSLRIGVVEIRRRRLFCNSYSLFLYLKTKCIKTLSRNLFFWMAKLLVIKVYFCVISTIDVQYKNLIKIDLKPTIFGRSFFIA